ncbi:unnamed protein product [Ascophyllum nodosum]
MIIPVRISGAPRATKTLSAGGKEGLVAPNWSMVELQGELISKEPLSGQSLGTMTLEGGKPTLVIGNHKLEGKEAVEPKPLLVLRKVIVPRPSKRGDGERDGDVNGNGTAVEYEVVGRVTKKTIFKTRPKPLIRKIR